MRYGRRGAGGGEEAPHLVHVGLSVKGKGGSHDPAHHPHVHLGAALTRARTRSLREGAGEGGHEQGCGQSEAGSEGVWIGGGQRERGGYSASVAGCGKGQGVGMGVGVGVDTLPCHEPPAETPRRRSSCPQVSRPRCHCGRRTGTGGLPCGHQAPGRRTRAGISKPHTSALSYGNRTRADHDGNMKQLWRPHMGAWSHETNVRNCKEQRLCTQRDGSTHASWR